MKPLYNHVILSLHYNYMTMLLPEEANFYTQLQKDVLQDKSTLSYRKLVEKFGFTSCKTLENFLFRAILGFKLDTIEGIAGPIPLVPDIITSAFVQKCMLQTIDLNCIYTHKALRILEDLLSERTLRAYQLAYVQTKVNVGDYVKEIGTPSNQSHKETNANLIYIISNQVLTITQEEADIPSNHNKIVLTKWKSENVG